MPCSFLAFIHNVKFRLKHRYYIYTYCICHYIYFILSVIIIMYIVSVIILHLGLSDVTQYQVKLIPWGVLRKSSTCCMGCLQLVDVRVIMSWIYSLSLKCVKCQLVTDASCCISQLSSTDRYVKYDSGFVSPWTCQRVVRMFQVWQV